MELTHSLENLEPRSGLQNILLRWSTYFAVFIVAIGILVLAGWKWDIISFERVLPRLPAMNPLTALCFLWSGISFLFLSGTRLLPQSIVPPRHIRLFIGKGLATLVLITAILKFIGVVPAIYQSVDSPMSSYTACCFLLSGSCLLFFNHVTENGHMPSQQLALLVGLMGFFSLISAIYRVQPFYGSISFVPLAAHTAICFSIFSLAVLFAHPGQGIMKAFTGAQTGSITARFMAPLVILLPVILGYLRMITYWKKLIPTEFGITILVFSIILTFTSIVWFNIGLLNKRDTLKQAAEDNLLESEARYRLLVSSVQDYAIFMLNRYGQVISWNEGAERIKGYKKEEIIGRNMSVFYTKEEIQRGEPQYNLFKAKEEGRCESEGWRVRKDGSLFWANVVFTAIHGPNGLLLGFAKVTRDITEKKEAMEKISYLARLVEDTSDAIFSTDTSFSIRSWNKAAESLFGYSFPEIRGKIAGEVLRTQLDEELRYAFQEELKKNGYWKGEILYLRKDNTSLTMLITISEVKNSEGGRDGYVMACRDFTERKRLEQQLKEFNVHLKDQVQQKTAELSAVFERITEAFIAVDKDFCYSYLNKKAGELIRREPASLLGKNMWEVFPDAIGSATYYAALKAMTEQRHITNTDYYQPLDIWQENHFYPSPEGLSIFIRNISEQRKNEKAITDYKYALDQSAIISITDEHGIIKYVNDNFCRISKYEPEELIGNDHRIIGSNYHSPAFLEQMWTTISKGNVWKGEFHNKAKDGTLYWVEMTIIPFLNEKKVPFEYMAIDSDITERKKSEKLLDQSYQEIRQLASHLQDIREEERAAIAREIHDELGQQLTGLKMDLSWITKSHAVRDDVQVMQKVGGIMGLLDTAIKTVRKIATDLRPSILDDLGLIAAIEWQSQEFQKRSGITTQFNCVMDEFQEAPATAIGLFRICQESLTNVARHAEATSISITLQEEKDKYILLKIEDNGKGFAFDQIGSKKTLGLLGMKERALIMGGDLRVTTEPGKGTTLIVTVPITSALT